MRLFVTLMLMLSLTSVVMASEGESRDEPYKATISADGVQRIEVLGGDYFFKPDHIIVKKGVPVEMVVRKTSGIVPHDIIIHAPDAGIDIKESIHTDPVTIRFTATKTGTYTFYCDKRLLFFKSHREKGMEGILEVVE